MTKNSTLTTVAVTVLMLVPAAGATWLSYGQAEPDTTYDTAGSFMWANAPGTIKDHVYFNAFTKYGGTGANGASANPNVGALGTRLDPAGPTSWTAILGVWTDCNGDGYVGMAETAVREYKGELLLDQTLCPASKGTANSWSGANNYNNWVTEFIPVGNTQTTNGDRRVYKDDMAMVWGDAGVPQATFTPPAAACPTTPLPGDSRNTGGYIRTLDCRGSRGIVSAFNDADATLGLGLGFGPDTANPQNSGSPLNIGTFGDDHSSRSAVYLQDCSQPATFNTGDSPAGDDFNNIDVIRPVPSNPVNGDVSSWTVPGTLNATREGATFIKDDNTNAPRGSDPEGNCNYDDDYGHDFYNSTEANAVINQDAGKRNAQWNFAFNTASRGTLPATALGGGAGGVPTDFGVDALGSSCTASSCLISQWQSVTTLNRAPPVTREDLTQFDFVNSGLPTIADAPYWSFYAFVGSATTSRFLTPGGSGKYGSAQCGSLVTGMSDGWNCNKVEWYQLADGTNTQDTTIRPLARVGQTYNLRDVDCLDGSTGLGVGTSPASFGTAPCPTV